MKSEQLVKTAGAVATLGAIVIGGMLIRSPRVHADGDDQQVRVRIGFQIAPVKLNLAGKDPTLVGLGSYLVNGVNDCNACHNSGAPPNFEYLSGGNPYLGQHPKVLDPKTYLGGGQDFGPAGPPPSPDIITRNLTPDKTGRPEGGHTFESFVKSSGMARILITCIRTVPPPERQTAFRRSRVLMAIFYKSCRGPIIKA